MPSFWRPQTASKQPRISAALKAIERFEISTKHKPFKKFNAEQARSFRARLLEAIGPQGSALSAATITSTLKHLQSFFFWLSREPGYNKVINANHARMFTPSDQDRRIAGARRTRPTPTLEDINTAMAIMPAGTHVEIRDRALLAFAIVSGARDGAIASFRLKHVDLDAQTVFQDGRIVKTKGRKTFTSTYFPVGAEPVEILTAYIRMLKDELAFGPDDPLFPSTLMGWDANRDFKPQGLTRNPWANADPIRRIFRAAFEAAGLPAFNPHSFRRTLALHMDTLDLSREEEKAYSQNFGHESIWTTRESYGTLPEHRQAAIMRRLAGPRAATEPDEEIASMQASLDRLKAKTPPPQSRAGPAPQPSATTDRPDTRH